MSGRINKDSRRVCDKLISGFNSFRYAITERISVIFARMKYERFYICEKEDPLISVYIPTYNRAALLMERSVPSILAQTYRNFELIIVGDCCTDNTEERLLKTGDPRIRFYNLPERKYRYPSTAENHWLAGPVVPANKALSLVRGKWIARIDDDDTWTPEHLEALLWFAQRGNYEFVSALYVEERYGRRNVIDGVRAEDSYYTRRPRPTQDKSPKIGGTSTWFYRSYLRFIKYDINCWRKAWNRVNDVDFSQRIFHAGVRMGFLEQVMAYVLPRPGETTVGLDAYLLTKEEKNEHFKFCANSILKDDRGRSKK